MSESEQNEELRQRLIQELGRRGTMPSRDVVDHAVEEQVRAQAQENSRAMAQSLNIGNTITLN